MKRIVLTLGLLAAVNCAAMADGNAFTPLNFNDTQYGSTTTTTTSTKSAPAASSAEGDAVGNGNIQNAILQLDNAQVDIRNDLLNCKTKYADVDAQYKLVKTERKALKNRFLQLRKELKRLIRQKKKLEKICCNKKEGGCPLFYCLGCWNSGVLLFCIQTPN